ncbi:MAG: hypothetical protein AB1571_04270 [Nanoarchaeota archaeon]
MNKRGITERQILYIFSIFIAISILIAFFMLAKNIREDRLFNQKFMAIETAYLVDVISMAPNDVEVVYDTRGFDFAFSQPCSVTVTPNLETVGSSKQCLADLNEDYKISNSQKLYFKKENNNIIIKNG